MELLRYGGFLSLFSYSYLFIPLVMYILLRWRDGRAASRDAQLGYKFGLHLLRFIAIAAVLTGVNLILISIFMWLLSAGPFRETAFQVGFGVLIPGVIVFILCYNSLALTNDKTQPLVARMFNGLLWLVTSIIAIVALAMLSTLIVTGEISVASAPIFIVLSVVLGAAGFYFARQVNTASVAE